MSKNNYPTLNIDQIRADEFSSLQETAYQNDIARLHKRLDEFISVSCPACDGKLSKNRFEKYRCKFLECEVCSTLYMSPRPTPELMNDYYTYSENYEVWRKYVFPKSEAIRREKISRPNLERIIKHCRLIDMPKPSLLEIGPGFGTFAKLAADSDFFNEIFLVERSPSMADVCRKKGLRVQGSSLEDSKELTESFEVAVCFEVIEHVFNPFDFLLHIRKALKLGGLFLFTCPNGKGFDTDMLQEAAPAVDTEHVNLFNPVSISVLLRRAGFEIISIETPGQLDVEIVRRAFLSNQTNLDKAPFWRTILIDRFEDLGVKFQHFLSENGLSGSMRVLAKKKAL